MSCGGKAQKLHQLQPHRGLFWGSPSLPELALEAALLQLHNSRCTHHCALYTMLNLKELQNQTLLNSGGQPNSKNVQQGMREVVSAWSSVCPCLRPGLGPGYVDGIPQGHGVPQWDG